MLMGIDAYNYELDQLQLRFRPGVGSAVRLRFDESAVVVALAG